MLAAGTILFAFYAALVGLAISIWGTGIWPIALAATALFGVFQYILGKKMALWSVGAEDLDENDYHRIHAAVEKMSREMVVFNRETGGNVGRLLNISVDGFKLFLRSPLEERQDLALGMVLPEPIEGINTLSFDARTIWCEEQERPGEYHAGFQFMELSEANRSIIEALIERF